MKAPNFNLTAKIIDIEARLTWKILINQEDCDKLGIRSGSRLLVHLKGQTIAVSVDVTDTMIEAGEVGIFGDVSKRFGIENGEILEFSLLGKPESLDAIQRNLLGKELSYSEIYSIVSDISSRKLNDVAIAFFVASSFFEKISPKELFYLTKAMAESGQKIHFPGIVADKHSVGGLCGNETTPIIVPIVASCGIYIPKTCSRAITSASGTADTFEVLAPVSLTVQEVKRVVQKTRGCIVWGAGDVAPADSRIIEVAAQLSIESFPKMISSIMAKKVALGVRYLVIDIPVNPLAKIKNLKKAKELKRIFEDLAKRLGIKIKVSINPVRGPIGRGIGSALQARDDMWVLEQRDSRPTDLEKRALELSGYVLELTGKARQGKGEEMAKETLISGRALMKIKEIVAGQGGNPDVSSNSIKLAKIRYALRAPKSGRIKAIQNHHLSEICRALGTPFIKGAGIYLEKEVGQDVKKGEALCTFYTKTNFHLELALKTLRRKKLFEIE